ncbi:MAG: HD-GYP domain-containing protein [Phycisphaerales bacterium]|nr:HD-GYP domain-containing protein [Phycisphaerales bacterium]
MTPDLAAGLVKAIEIKDACTAAHTWRVVLYTRAMAEAAGLPHELTERLTFAAALHDVGKIDIPDGVLRKPGPLTATEFGIIKAHPVMGHDMLVQLGETDPVVLELVRHHHERVDGKGYPDGIAGDRIHIAARMFAVIDSFDAMTSARPYRASGGEQAVLRGLAELRAGAGTKYDPDAVRMFTDLYERGTLSWIHEYFNDGATAAAWSGERRLASRLDGLGGLGAVDRGLGTRQGQ